MNRNLRVALMAGGFALGMVGMAYASVPLYRLFCQVTGFGGTPQRAALAPAQMAKQMVTIRFDGNVDASIPWAFKPVRHTARLHIGEQGLAFYEAKNTWDKPITGTATFNVSPDIAGQYFTKIECFCFQEQTLQPGQTVQMPVAYFVDPAILDDPVARNLPEITLSYTFYRVDNPTQPAGIKVTQVASKTAVN
jgi:cytochrome c oxidase assembly protein subunit 11